MYRLGGVAATILLAACSVRGDTSPSRAPEKVAVVRSEGIAGGQETSTLQGKPTPSLTIRIGLGETARIADAGFEVTFSEVLSDSRCPRGEACVWEGDAAILLHLRVGVEAGEVELHTAAGGPGSAGFAEWHVEFLDLQPVPVAGRSTPPHTYTASLRVTRGLAPEAPEIAIQ